MVSTLDSLDLYIHIEHISISTGRQRKAEEVILAALCKLLRHAAYSASYETRLQPIASIVCIHLFSVIFIVIDACSVLGSQLPVYL